VSRDIGDTIEINASPATIWATLTDTGSCAAWNPFLRRGDGELRAKAKLDVQIEPPGAPAMSFKPTVLAVESKRELRWIGHLIVPGLFDGEHSFRLEPLDSGGTRFTTAEHFSGLLVPVFNGTIDKTQKGFEQMSAALRARAEEADAGRYTGSM
jgi:hypothetical protein